MQLELRLIEQGQVAQAAHHGSGIARVAQGDLDEAPLIGADGDQAPLIGADGDQTPVIATRTGRRIGLPALLQRFQAGHRGRQR